jgi:hypothetical protein
MRAFYAGGVDKMRVPRVVEALSALIHLYLFLFFAGLAIFLFNINHSVFICAISWIGLFTVVYVWMTVMPIFWHHSPYYAPLSSTAWFLHASMLHALFTVVTFIARTVVSRHTRRRFRDLSKHYGRRMSGGVSKAAEKAALEKSLEIDVGILNWTAGILGEDETQERFFEAIPGFLNSQNVKNLERPLPHELRLKIIDSLEEFLDRNLSSNSVSRKIKNRRLVICMNATKEVGEADDIYRILLSLLTSDTLGEDDTREKFFEAIPSFLNSQRVKTLKRFLPDIIHSKLVGLLEEFLVRNLSSNAVSEEIKIHRVIICMNATKEIGESTDISKILSHLTNDALGEDEKLQEKLFEIIPNFLKQMPDRVPKSDICDSLYPRLRDALDGFLFRTLPSNTVIESVKNHRLGIYLNAIKVIYNPEQVFDALSDILDGKFGQLPQSIETANILARAGSYYTDDEGIARCLVANVLLTIQQRDDRWIALVTDQFGLPKHELRDHIAHGGNNVLLAILIHVARQVIRTDSWDYYGWILSSLSKFDIHHTLPGLQNEFCALWNEIVLRARDDAFPYVNFLHHIRQLYIVLHQGTDAAPTAFDDSTGDVDPILDWPSSYPLCNIAAHHPHSTIPPPNQLDHPSRSESQSIPSRSTTPQQAEEANIVLGPPSSPDHNPPAQEFPSPSLTTDPVHIPPHVTSVTVPSVHESSQIVSLDSNRAASTEIFHLLPESSPSTANLTTNIVHNESTPDIPINDIGETSTVTLFTSPNPDPLPITVTSFTVPHPPSVFVEQQGDFSDNSQPITSNLMLIYPLDREEQLDITASHDASEIAQISSTSNQISRPISNIGVTVQTSDESTGVPLTTVSDPQSSVIVMLPSPPPSSVILAELASSVESALVQPDHLSHPLGPPSSTLTTAHSHISPQIPSILDDHVTTSIGSLSSPEHQETRDPNPLAPMEASLPVQQPGPSTPDVGWASASATERNELP